MADAKTSTPLDRIPAFSILHPAAPKRILLELLPKALSPRSPSASGSSNVIIDLALLSFRSRNFPDNS